MSANIIENIKTDNVTEYKPPNVNKEETFNVIQQFYFLKELLIDGENLRFSHTYLAEVIIIRGLKVLLTTPDMNINILNLSGNTLSGFGIMVLSSALVDDNCKLTDLSMVDIRITHDKNARTDTTSLDFYSLSQLSFALSNLKCKLTSLNLSKNQIGDDGAGFLAGALEKNKTLTTLVLAENNIGDGGAGYLAGALKVNHTLVHLNLSGNQIGPGGALSFILTLRSNQKLTHLDLSGNQIGANGAGHLAHALISNQTLTTLSLRSNDIGDDGAKALAGALRSNQTLTHLDLSVNLIKDDTVHIFSDVNSGKMQEGVMVDLDDQFGNFYFPSGQPWSLVDYV